MPGLTEPPREHYQDTARFFRLLLPFLQKWANVPSNYEEIYQQALKDLQQPGCVATGGLLTVWGTRPKNGKTMLIRGLP